MNGKKREKIIKEFGDWFIQQYFQDSGLKVPPERFLIDLTEKAVVEDIKKDLEKILVAQKDSHSSLDKLVWLTTTNEKYDKIWKKYGVGVEK
jgi:hypothetical protein